MNTHTGERRLISDAYLKQQQLLHQNPDYGAASMNFVTLIKQFMEQSNLESLSDYGAGKQVLIRSLNQLHNFYVPYFPYDPAFPEYGEPKPADLVCCIDVLEHIEPEYLDGVIEELARITVKYGLFSVHSGPAVKTLSDGRNAHLIQQPSSWWLPKFCRYFEIFVLKPTAEGFYVIVTPRGSQIV